MQIHTLTFNNDINVSLQVGDVVYYSPTGTIAGSGFSTVNSVGSIVKFGVVSAIYNDGLGNNIPPHSVLVMFDETTVLAPRITDYIMFSKNKQVNSSSIIGYYAKAHFVNNSTKEIELFSVGSDIFESSK